jgi:spore maturation protein CgeB
VKIAFLYVLYDSYLDQVYAESPWLRTELFQTQREKLMEDGFGTNGAWTAALKPLGYEVLEIYANAAPLQRAWASEESIPWPRLNWLTEIAFSQVKAFEPDVLFLDDPIRFSSAWLTRLRNECRSLRLMIGSFGAPNYDIAALKQCDLLLSCNKGLILDCSRKSIPVNYFKHAFDTSILPDLPVRRPCREEVLFTGGLVRSPGFHLNREAVLETLASQVPLAIHCPQASISIGQDITNTAVRRGVYAMMKTLNLVGFESETLGKLPRIGPAARWKAWPRSQLNPLLRPHMRPAFYGLRMLAAMRTSAVSLNIQPETNVHGGMNMRLFEGTGVGTCLLTDHKEDLSECFEPDREIVTYRNPEECREKAQWLLAHPKEREEIAAAGQRRCMRDHTRDMRAVELNEMILSKLRNISRPPLELQPK